MSSISTSTQSPLVSVIIPAYNAETFLERTLRSVLTQTYLNLQVIVVDDGSQDQTAEIVRRIAQQDERVTLLQQPNAGVAAARNLGIHHAKGEFIAPIDADDLWYPDNARRQVNCLMQSGAEVGLVYSWSVNINEADCPTGGFRAAKIEGDVYHTLICHNFLGNASASMMRRACLDQIGLYNADLRIQQAQGCEDWDLYLRIAEHYQFRVVPDFLVGYRKLTDSMSCDYRTMARSHHLVMEAVKAKHPGVPPLLFNLSSSNLYIYFAHESARSGNYQVTLDWLKAAFRSAPLFSLIRYGFHRLWLKAVWSLFVQPSPHSLLSSPSIQQLPATTSQLDSAYLEFRSNPITLFSMLLVGHMFNLFIRLFVSNTQVPRFNVCRD